MSKTNTAARTAPVAMLAFHNEVFAIARTGHNAGLTMAKKMQALLVARYGKALIDNTDTEHWGKPCAAGGPSYEAYRNDQAALAELAKQKGLTDNQWVRKPYAAAVKALYGALPVAMTAEAIQKRAQREANEAAKKAADAAAKAGAPKGETTERAPSESETLEQLIARVGVFQALDACVRILGSESMTKPQAMHIAAMVKAAKAAAQAPAPAATTKTAAPAKTGGKRKAA